MKELLTPHWFLGGSLSIGGGLAYRFGPHVFAGNSLIAFRIAGLICLSVGLFVVMRGVNREAVRRPPLDEKEAVRRVPGLRRLHKDEKS
jgi:hypothetical protein